MKHETAMSRRIILLLSAVFLKFAFTRSAPMVIDVINSEKGLLSNTILSITEDSFGRMWIGTANGISCYNGDMPMNISVNTAPRRISNKYAQSLLPMENGDVWIGTPDRLNIYSYQGDSVFIANRQKIGISDITTLLMSRDKRTIWIGSTDQGVGAYDLPEGRFRKLQFPDSTNLPKHIITLCEDPNDYLWIGTRYDGIYIYDLKNGKLSGFPMQHATVNALCTGRSGTMWIGTHDGLFGGTVNGPMVRISHPMVDHIKIMAIVEDRNGTIWVGGDNGLGAFSPESVTPDNRITDLRSVSEGPGIGKLTYRYVSALYYDKKQTLWVGTFGGGINILDISEFSPSVITPIEDMQDGNSSNKTLAICRGNDDDLWFGMDGHGVVRYDLKTGQKQVFSGSDIHDSVIVSLCRDENGYIWAGGYYNGLAYLAPGSDRFVAIRNTPHNETIRAIATDEGKIYYNNDSDLFCYDFLSKRTTRPLAGRLNKKLDIRTIVIDRETIWLGTYHNGIIGYDRETGRITEIPVHKDFGNAVVWDMVLFDRQLWCATDLGLFRTDLTGDPLRGEFIASPDPGSKSFVAVASDDNGKLWLSGTSKIYCYDITAQKYTQVTTPKMLSVTDYSDAAILIDRTETYVGGFKGVAIVRDRRESPDTIQARELFLANLNINNHPVYPGARRSPLKKNLNAQERIVLSHKQNNISLDFIIPYFGYEIASYRYRIKERSNEWSELGASHTLSINNMPYGKYTLEIEGSIADSPKVFSRTLQLVFRPPFYLSTGAKSLYLLLVVLAAFVAVRITKTRIELKHTLEMEQANRKKDEELNEAKISFFTTISHELRTPLTLLLAPIDQLKAYETNSSKLKNYQLIERNAKTLLSLVNQILDFRKNEKGEIRLQVARTDIRTLIADIILPFDQLAGYRNIAFQASFPQSGTSVCIDADILTKIINNLLSNAFKFTEPGGKITLTADITSNELVLSVADTGIGMAKEQQEKVFDIFYQGDNAQTKYGSGLGLYLVKSLVKIHHGDISVESTPGIGTTFRCTLPCREDFFIDSEFAPTEVGSEKEVIREPDTQPEEKMESGDKGKEETILIVEDNEDIVEFLTDSLGVKYNIHAVSNGAQALEKLNEIPETSLVITDVMMPIMDGITLCREIKTNFDTSHIPVIILSAKSEMEDMMNGLRCGADAYISKPFSLTHLKIQIEKLIEIRKTLKEKYRKSLNFSFNNEHEDVLSAENRFLNDITQIILQNLSDVNLNVDYISSAISMSRASLYRKLKSITGLSVNDFIRNIRLSRAEFELRETPKTISEIAYDNGFSTPSYFSTCFTIQYGCSPKAYRQNNEAKKG